MYKQTKSIVSAVATVEKLARPSSRLLVFRGVGDGFYYQREGRRHMKACSEHSLICFIDSVTDKRATGNKRP